jgi:signal transduction histidine kinase
MKADYTTSFPFVVKGNLNEQQIEQSRERIAGRAVGLTRQLIRHRWFIMLSISVLVLVAQIEGHQVISPFTQDLEFWHDVLLFSVGLPLSWGLLLTLVSYTDQERLKVEYELEQQYLLGQQLSEAANWTELVESIVNFPRLVVPVSGTSLHIYNSEQDRFELAAEWPHEGPVCMCLTPIISRNMCTAHKAAASSSKNIARVCLHMNNGWSKQPGTVYCLPLVQEEQPLALLHLYFPKNIRLTSNQQRILNSAAQEMTLALVKAQLQRSVVQQAEANETERKRIAQNLHDSLGQNVSYLRLKLDQLTGEDAFLEISLIKLELERMRDIADEAYRQVRGTLADLRPSNHVDLKTALLQQGSQVSARSGIKVLVTSEGQPKDLPQPTRNHLLFICKEAMNNVEKHAQAEQVNIHLSWMDAVLGISISDDGIGFDPSKGSPEGHYGLTIMSERAEEIGANLCVNSAAYAGTEIILEVPLNKSFFFPSRIKEQAITQSLST